MINRKRIISGLLGATICLSLFGCGKKQEDFSDYGNIEDGETVELSNETGKSTEASSEASVDETGSMNQSEESDGNIQIEDTEWKEAGLSVKGVSLTADTHVLPTLLTEPKIYEGTKPNDFKDDEDKIVKSIFGETAKKIETISFKNSTDYITFLYKYRLLLLKFKNTDEYSEQDFIENSRENGLAINSAFTEEYKWIDTEDYSIHMYEGNYNNCNFGLLLAYNYKTNTRFIFLDPISIEGYFPGCNYKTMNICSGFDAIGKPVEIENNCKYTADEVKQMASDLLVNSFGMSDDELDLTSNHSWFNQAVWPIGSWESGGVISYQNGEWSIPAEQNSTCSLIFSDADAYTMATNDGRSMTSAGYFRLADQDYNLPEGTDFDDFVSNHLGTKADGINYTTDGYAIFVNSGYSGNLYNSGVVKVTSKGIYGVDLVQKVHVDSVSDVEMMDFEDIKACLIKGLDKDLDLDKMKNPTSLVIYDSQLDIGELENKEESGDKFIAGPCWIFIISGDDMSAVVTVDAQDGSIVYISYNDFTFR